jgi:hypothetical protein
LGEAITELAVGLPMMIARIARTETMVINKLQGDRAACFMLLSSDIFRNWKRA